jgi:hypothetical protein
MKDCNLSHTPMKARLQLSKASSEVVVDATEYCSVVGALRYLVHTRPDLAHTVNYVIRFMAEPHEDHEATAKRILRYIAGTYDHGIHHGKGREGSCCY